MPIDKNRLNQLKQKEAIKKATRSLDNLRGISASSGNIRPIADSARIKRRLGYGDLTFGKNPLKNAGIKQKVYIYNDENDLIVVKAPDDANDAIILRPSGSNLKVQNVGLINGIISEYELDDSAEKIYFDKIDFEEAEDGTILMVISMKEGVSYAQ